MKLPLLCETATVKRENVMFTTRPELVGTFGVVTTTHWLGSAVGMSVLEKGGNDAGSKMNNLEKYPLEGLHTPVSENGPEN